MTRYTVCGKEIKRDGVRLADAVDNEAAAHLMAALEAFEAVATQSIIDENQFDWLEPQAGHIQRREQDEWVCSCGVRYAVDEDHP